MKYIYLTISIIILNNIPLLFRDASVMAANFSYDACQQLTMIILISFIFSMIPKNNFKARGLILLLALIFGNVLLNYISYMFSFPTFSVQYPLGILLFSYLIYTTLNWKEYPRLRIYKDKSYFVFKKPKNFMHFLITIFKSPVSSFSIINNNKWYIYTKKAKGLTLKNPRYLDQNKYFVIKVKKLDDEILSWLVGRQWSLLKSNCVTIFRPVFKDLEVKLGKLDFIPSVFAYKFLNGKYGI